MDLKERLLVEFFLRKALEAEPVVHVPGLGSFFAESVPDGGDVPVIGFESGFSKEGKDFSAFFGVKQGLEAVEARIVVNRYVDWLTDTVLKKPVEIEGIGWFYPEGSEIRFSRTKPDLARLMPQEGLPDPAPKEEGGLKPVSDNRQLYLLIGVIVVILVVLYAVGLFTDDRDVAREPRPGSDSIQQDTLPFDTTSESVRFERERLARQRLEDSVAKALEREMSSGGGETKSASTSEPSQVTPDTRAKTQTIPPEPKPKTPSPSFVIIVGSFQEQLVAEKLRNDLVTKGFQAGVSSTDQKMWRVHVGNFTNREEAKAFFESKVKSLYPAAWVVEKK